MRPRGARPLIAPILHNVDMFQSTRPRGARLYSRRIKARVFVSIHAPAWGATHHFFCMLELIMFQSTRPRGARHWTQQGRRKMLYVSIHAPAWGATRPTPPILQPAWFQSTRPRGARPKASSIILTHSSFNPRARVGRDLQARLQSCACVCRFNPRARVGRDTPSGANCVSLNSFNPRARVGRDFDACASGEDALVSIHAPAWGATVSHRRHTSLYARFNPRARVGRDLVGDQRVGHHGVSIHAPAWGATGKRAVVQFL